MKAPQGQQPDDEFVPVSDGDAADHFDTDEIEDEAGAVEKIKKIKKELQKCQDEKGEYLAGWQRAKADFVNRERMAKEDVARAGGAARGKILEDLLPILDGFDMAIQSPAWQNTDPAWRGGMEALYKQLQSVLTKNSIESFGTIGEPFDPSMHEAVSTSPAVKESDDHKVSAVLQKGYRSGDRVIRAARVVIGEYK